jgi:hypothetical protein
LLPQNKRTCKDGCGHSNFSQFINFTKCIISLIGLHIINTKAPSQDVFVVCSTKKKKALTYPKINHLINNLINHLNYPKINRLSLDLVPPKPSKHILNFMFNFMIGLFKQSSDNKQQLS